jgi:hypothetical protein
MSSAFFRLLFGGECTGRRVEESVRNRVLSGRNGSMHPRGHEEFILRRLH